MLKNLAAGETKISVDRASHAIELTRELPASRIQVFEAWTQPEHVRCWWGPTGHPLDACEIDLRVGGAFRFVSGLHEFKGVYLEISPPGRLVFEAMGATGRVILAEKGGMTHLTVRIECSSAAHLDHFLKAGIDTGTAKTLDNLYAHVSGPKT